LGKEVKPVLFSIGLTLFSAFAVCVIVLPFSWRVGSRPEVARWLRANLPSWLLSRLDRKCKDDLYLCLYLTKWMSGALWLAMVIFGVLSLLLLLVFDGERPHNL
jgi:hypothetical protein